jgi:hypothetical protein
MSGSLRHGVVSSQRFSFLCSSSLPLLLFSFPVFPSRSSFSLVEIRLLLTSGCCILLHLSRRKPRRHAASRCKGCHDGEGKWNPIGLRCDGGPVCVGCRGLEMNCAAESRTWREADRLRRWPKLSWLPNICIPAGIFRNGPADNPVNWGPPSLRHGQSSAKTGRDLAPTSPGADKISAPPTTGPSLGRCDRSSPSPISPG